MTFFRCKKYAHVKYILNRIQCLTISRLPGFLTPLTPIIVINRYGQNNKAHRKVQLAPVMTLYSQVQQDTSRPRLFYRPVSFTASTLEADGGGGCRYGGVANKEESYCWVAGEFLCIPKSTELTGFHCCSSALYPLENEFC